MIAVILAVASSCRRSPPPGTRFKAVDESRQHVAANWADHVLDVMEPTRSILSWWSYSTPLWYAQRVQGKRPDIAIIDDRTRLDENLGGLTETIDANLGQAARLRHPGRPARGQARWPSAMSSTTSTAPTPAC